MGKMAGKAHNIGEDNARLRNTVAELAEAVSEARKELSATAKIPMGSLGRVKDVFDALNKTVSEKVTTLSSVEVAEERTAAREALRRLREELETAARTELKSTVGKLTSDCAERVDAAEAREKTTRKAYTELAQRSASSEELLHKADESVAEAHQATAKAEAAVSQIEAENRKAKEAWENAIEQALADCSLKAHTEEKVQDTSKPWRAKQNSAAEQLTKQLDKVTTPGDQLKVLLAAYESARREDDELRAMDVQEAKEALTMAHEETRAKVKEAIGTWATDRDRLLHKLAEKTELASESEKKMHMAQSDLNKVHKVAQEQAMVKARSLESELKEKNRELKGKQAELDAVRKEVQTWTETHASSEASYRSETAALKTLVAAERTKMYGLHAELEKLRAAGQTRAGYFFSAAPTLPNQIRSFTQDAQARRASMTRSPPPYAGAAPPTISNVVERTPSPTERSMNGTLRAGRQRRPSNMESSSGARLDVNGRGGGSLTPPSILLRSAVESSGSPSTARQRGAYRGGGAGMPRGIKPNS